MVLVMVSLPLREIIRLFQACQSPLEALRPAARARQIFAAVNCAVLYSNLKRGALGPVLRTSGRSGP